MKKGEILQLKGLLLQYKEYNKEKWLDYIIDADIDYLIHYLDRDLK